MTSPRTTPIGSRAVTGPRSGAGAWGPVGPDADVLPRADLSQDQHFLTCPAKLGVLMAAAGIRPDDDVVEFGAGAGTVAARVPVCRSLTLVEYDPRLVAHLTPRFPRATVRQGDALDLVHTLRFDVLLSNLPWQVTADLLPYLLRVPLRVAVLAVDPVLDLDTLTRNPGGAGDGGSFDVEPLTVLDGPDVTPPQDVLSHLIRLSRDPCAFTGPGACHERGRHVVAGRQARGSRPT